MGDLVFLGVAGLIFYLAYCFVGKHPIIPTKKNKEKAKQRRKNERNQVSEEYQKELLNERWNNNSRGLLVLNDGSSLSSQLLLT